MRKHKQTLDSSLAKRIVRRIVPSRPLVGRIWVGSSYTASLSPATVVERRITQTIASRSTPNWLGCDTVTLFDEEDRHVRFGENRWQAVSRIKG
ncbi:MAG: hypothetical protein VX106_02665 [Pseudomonadota bacterium]|nr:hypothetical protein [Pseudomonadota bacterium]